MSLVRKLMLLVLMAGTVLASLAAPASAKDPILVVDEKSGNTCGDVVSPHTSSGCIVHAVGTVLLEINTFGIWIEEDTCDIEVEMRVGGDGTAAVFDLDHYATEPGIDEGSQECEVETPVTMCNAPWEGSGEESAAQTVRAGVAVCIDSDEVDACGSQMSFDIAEGGVQDQETYEVIFARNTIGSLCRITGVMQMEATKAGNADIHVNHL